MSDPLALLKGRSGPDPAVATCSRLNRDHGGENQETHQEMLDLTLSRGSRTGHLEFCRALAEAS